MAPRNRALFALVGLISLVAAGCSGSKNSGGTPPTSSPTSTSSASSSPTDEPSGRPTSTATATSSGTATSTPFVLSTATPVPAATTAPTGNPNVVNSRPLANGDVFRYSGTTNESFVYEGVTPNPSSTYAATVTQTVNVASNKTYNGNTGLTEFTTTETDAGIDQTTSITTNAYYALTNGPTDSGTQVTQQALTTYGSTSTDSDGESLGIVLTNPGFDTTTNVSNGTVDLVPEQRSPTWSNTQAQVISQSESDGFSATRTYAANGTYVENATYPQSTASSPQPSNITTKITENSDGSGQYDLPLFQSPNININFAAPTGAGLIDITFNDTDGTLLDSEQTSAWFAQPLSLYTEIDRDNGAVKYPSACNVSSTYGTTGNQVEQKYTRTDTILGTLEFFDQLTYVSSNGTAACVQLNDVTYIYYDYSGQSNPNAGVAFGGGNSPYETQTLATTLGITGETVNSVARGTDATTGRAVAASAIANARANFVHTIDRNRALRERAMVAHLRTRFATRLHR